MYMCTCIHTCTCMRGQYIMYMCMQSHLLVVLLLLHVCYYCSHHQVSLTPGSSSSSSPWSTLLLPLLLQVVLLPFLLLPLPLLHQPPLLHLLLLLLPFLNRALYVCNHDIYNVHLYSTCSLGTPLFFFLMAVTVYTQGTCTCTTCSAPGLNIFIFNLHFCVTQ